MQLKSDKIGLDLMKWGYTSVHPFPPLIKSGRNQVFNKSRSIKEESNRNSLDSFGSHGYLSGGSKVLKLLLLSSQSISKGVYPPPPPNI